MKEIKLILGLFTFVTIYSCNSKILKDDSKFHGMWSLDKIESFDSLANRWADASSWVGWNGYILYDGQGHMGVHLTPKGYKEFNTTKNIDSLNHDELVALTKFYKSNFVYFSDYTLTDSTIEHKRLSATEPQNWGKSLIRDFKFNQDTLILTAHEIIARQKLRLRWIKLK
ncbi:MAG: lipocalin-like domain-containing protein [Bacteroidetes bacterium]|nr:lipocalin-like domain-containing protein [Bacteroidota bacterium]MBS1539313.1 lipocalin-like domain-containing protein [Bacteroidota bacterium]